MAGRFTEQKEPSRGPGRRLPRCYGSGARRRRGVPERRPSDPPPVRRRPSVAPSARSRGGDGEGLRPRRWHAGGLSRRGSSCTGAVYRGGCPVRHCAERGVQPGGHRRHNVKPGTPRCGPYARVFDAGCWSLSLSLSLSLVAAADRCRWLLPLIAAAGGCRCRDRRLLPSRHAEQRRDQGPTQRP